MKITEIMIEFKIIIVIVTAMIFTPGIIESKKYSGRRTNNVVAAATAQFDLELALRSAENGEKYGIEAERVSDLANQYVKLAEQGVEAYKGLNENSELAVDAAVKNIRLKS